jgi:hypothetical protein
MLTPRMSKKPVAAEVKVPHAVRSKQPARDLAGRPPVSRRRFLHPCIKKGQRLPVKRPKPSSFTAQRSGGFWGVRHGKGLPQGKQALQRAGKPCLRGVYEAYTATALRPQPWNAKGTSPGGAKSGLAGVLGATCKLPWRQVMSRLSRCSARGACASRAEVQGMILAPSCERTRGDLEHFSQMGILLEQFHKSPASGAAKPEGACQAMKSNRKRPMFAWIPVGRRH